MMRRWTVFAFLGMCLPGCGGDDGDSTGTASGGASSGGSGGIGSGGTGATPSGGSGGVSGSGNVGGTAGATGGSAGVAGSGNVGGSAGAANLTPLNQACYAMCDQQEKGENCLKELTQLCKDGCNGVTPALETKCPEVAKAYYDCGASIDYVCILGLATAKDKDACKDENAAMNACTGAK